MMWSTFVMSRSNAQKRLSLTCSHLLYKYDKPGCIDGLHHIMSMFTSDAIAATLEVHFKNIKDILSFQLLASASVSAL